MDDKGRLPLPVRLREKLTEAGESCLVLASWDGGIQGFTGTRWRKMERRFAGVSLFDRGSRAFLHAYVASAAEVEPDAQGRILIPPPMRRQAGLQKDCVILSFLGLLEIWDSERWLAKQEESMRTVLEGDGLSELLAFEDDGEDL